MDQIRQIGYQEELTLYSKPHEVKTTSVEDFKDAALSILSSVKDYFYEQGHPSYAKASSLDTMADCSEKFKNLRSLIKDAFPLVLVVDNSVNRDPVDRKVLIAKEYTIGMEHGQQLVFISEAAMKVLRQLNCAEVKILAIAKCAIKDIDKTIEFYSKREDKAIMARITNFSYSRPAKPNRVMNYIEEHKCCVGTLGCVVITATVLGVFYGIILPSLLNGPNVAHAN